MDRQMKNRLHRLTSTRRQEPTPVLSSTPDSAARDQCHLSERLGLLNKPTKPGQEKEGVIRTPELQNDTTAAYFKQLGNPGAGCHGASSKTRKREQAPQEAVPSSDLPRSDELIEKLMNAYGERSYEISARTNAKLDAARDKLDKEITAMADSDKVFLAQMAKSQKWAGYSLSNRIASSHPTTSGGGGGEQSSGGAGTGGGGDGGGAQQLNTIGDRAAALRIKLDATKKEVDALCRAWETIDDQVKGACDELVAGNVDAHTSHGGPSGASRTYGLVDGGSVDQQISRLIAAAEAELQRLEDEAVEEVERAEEDMRAKFKQETARVADQARRSMDMYFSDGRP